MGGVCFSVFVHSRSLTYCTYFNRLYLHYGQKCAWERVLLFLELMSSVTEVAAREAATRR